MRKVTLLLGAGAALPWGAPSTSAITDAILKNQDHFVGSQTLGEWMQSVLVGGFTRNYKINFENYIDFVESLHIHLTTAANSTTTSPDVLNAILTLKDNIAKGIEILKWKNGSSFSTDVSKIISTYYSLIRIVRNQIWKYLPAFENDTIELNTDFRLFCEYFINLDFSLRAYTLNYDRSIPLIFERSNPKINFFDGFNVPVEKDERLFSLNKHKIITDQQCNCFYNLHGSFHWHFQGPPYVINSSRQAIHFPENPDVAEYPIPANPNEKILPTSIITGFRKTQRINTEPYSYLYHSFFRDIQDSTLIIIVGYSYSDPHINKLILEALRNKTRVYNITWVEHLESKIKSGYGGTFGHILRNSYPEHSAWFQAPDAHYSEYPKGFAEFLKTKEWKNIQPS